MIPSPPQNVVLQTGNGQILLSWSLSIGATSYSIQRSTDGLTFTSLGTSTAPYYVDSAPTIGVMYYYQVAAVSSSGSSPFSASYPTSIVACMPGQINLGYLRYQAQLRADKLNSQYLTLDEWNFNINQLAYELYDLLISKYGEDYFMSPPLLMNLNGSLSYTIPDGILYSGAPALYKLTGVDVNIAGGLTSENAGWVPAPRANWQDRDRWTVWPGQPIAVNNTYTVSYRVMGNQLFIFPQNLGQQLRLWYIPMMTQMLLDTDMLSFSISGWSEYVIIKAAMLSMSKEESSEKYALLEKQLAMQLERIEVASSNRDVGEPNAVSNYRQVKNDPSFGFGWGGGSNGFNGAGGM